MLRIISVVPELKKIIEALLSSVKRVFYVGLLLFIILYIYATIGSILFSTNIPERWGDVGVAMITLFQVLTLSSWEQVMLPLQDVYWWAWIYFFQLHNHLWNYYAEFINCNISRCSDQSKKTIIN